MRAKKADLNTVNPETKGKVEANHMNESSKIKNKKSKTRINVVLLFIIFVAIIGYVIFRGEYLEILETGNEYINIFWQNVNYTAITFGVNFLILFIVIYINNVRIKNALKPFFETEKKVMPKLPNKSISLILSVVISAIATKIMLNQYILFANSTSAAADRGG